MPCKWCAVPVLTLNVLFVSPAPAQQVTPPSPLIAAPESQPASAVAESTDMAAPAPAKTKRTTAQSKSRRITPIRPYYPLQAHRSLLKVFLNLLSLRPEHF